MWKSTKWKVVAGAATLSALGIGSMALADSDESPLPSAINLKDHVTTRTLAPIPDFVVSSNNQVDLTDLDSPFDDDPTYLSAEGSADTPATPGPSGSPTDDSVDGADSLGDSFDSAGS